MISKFAHAFECESSRSNDLEQKNLDEQVMLNGEQHLEEEKAVLGREKGVVEYGVE